MSVTEITPGVTLEKTIDFADIFTIPFNDNDAIAVRIVRSSDAYNYKTQSPRLRLCRQLRARCDDDSKNNSLSFEISASELSKVYKKNTFQFSLSALGGNMNSGVVVGIYACVGPDASLATCKGACSKTCEHGMPSNVMNVCVCEKGYTGSYCDTKSVDPTNPEFYSNFEELDALFDFICGVISFVCSIVFFIVLITIISFCCCIIRGCCCRHRRNGTVVPRHQRPVPPPPAYPGGGYRPLGMMPPPPPPPPPPPMQPPQYYPVNGIEMAVLPAAKTPNPVYIMPPLAPVRQVPVFVQPPAPKN